MKLLGVILTALLAVLLLAERGQATEADQHSTAAPGSGHDDHAVHWGYHSSGAPGFWGVQYPLCAATNDRQSPVNIPERQTLYVETLEPIDLTVAKYRAEDRFMIKNNGHSVVITVPSHVLVRGGSLGDMYKVHSFHFHWGSDSTRGSEHTRNNKQFPLEMHMVTYDRLRFTSLTEAANGSNSLAVLGTFFEISEKNNSVYANIINSLKEVRHPDDEAVLPFLELRELLPKNLADYYRYLGSLTTPPCFQSVIWTLFKTPQTISELQMIEFRSLFENHPANPEDGVPLVNNYRPVQDLQKRKIERSFRFESEITSYNPGNGNVNTHDDHNRGAGFQGSAMSTSLLALLSVASYFKSYHL